MNALSSRQMIHDGADRMAAYLGENYCPSLPEDEAANCPDTLAEHFPDMEQAVVHRFIVEGAQHMCQTLGACHPQKE
jgi:hypothetical protein